MKVIAAIAAAAICAGAVVAMSPSASAQTCRDGWVSDTSAGTQGACSWHGGVGYSRPPRPMTAEEKRQQKIENARLDKEMKADRCESLVDQAAIGIIQSRMGDITPARLKAGVITYAIQNGCRSALPYIERTYLA